MIRISCLIISIPLYVQAQKKGIQFMEGLTWNQVKTKAEKENKYIFVDCFTTWCGPCKLMEKEVYSNEEVGSYFNIHFISAKLQMDKTDKDNDLIRNWYKDSDSVQKEYGIPAYPTYLFFSSKGKLVNRDVGYKNVVDFLELGKNTVTITGITRRV